MASILIINHRLSDPVILDNLLATPSRLMVDNDESWHNYSLWPQDVMKHFGSDEAMISIILDNFAKRSSG